MSTETDDTTAQPSMADLAARLDAVEEELSMAATTTEEDGPTKMTIIAIHGSLDMAYPTLILSSLASAFDWDVTVFASFWALDLLHEKKSKQLKLSSLGNTALPVPNLLGVLPGMDRVTTRMMKKRIADVGTAPVDELIQTAMDNGVEFQACQMTADLMGYEEDDFIDGVRTGVGAAVALMDMEEADIQLVI